ATWEHGDLAQRRAMLTRIRRYTPDTARDWLAATWKSEKADSRLAFLGVLEQRLSPADEPFLKEAMTDRSEKVRARATELLLQLPTSALHARLLSIADACLSFKPRQDTWQSRIRALGKVQRQGGLEVQLPEEDGFDWGLAGIHEKSPGHDAASRHAWYLERVLSLVSPAHWSDRFDVEPADLIGAAESSDWSGPLLRAWTSAATRHHVEDWIGPLWHWWSGTLLRPGQESGAGPLLDALFRALPSDTAEAEVIRLLHSSDATAVQFAIDVLGNLPAPWTPAIGAAYVQALKSLVRNLPRTSQPMLEPREMSFYQSIPMAAYRLPHTCFNLVPQAWDIPEVPALLPWRRLLYRLSESILIRRFLRHELTS
ncbi:MAG: hypothetical protein JWO42_3102, partial [Chloroflexi bacterium]|nr:hypothetical protein [Chloroflexota bacterium]